MSHGVVVLWESLFAAGNETEGLTLTRQVWEDMRAFSGYIGHEILVDEENPRHIFQIGRWQTRADADSVREKYKDSDTIKRLTPLLEKPRARWITVSAT